MDGEDRQRRRRLLAVAVVALPILASLLIIAVVNLAGGNDKRADSGPDAGAGQILAPSRSRLEPGAAAPRMRLTNARTGQALDTASLRGTPYAVVFFSTRCTAVAAALRRGIDALGPAAARVSVLVVSTDPRRDSATRVRHWLRAERMPPRLRFLVGAAGRLRRYRRAWAVSPAAVARCEDVAPAYLVGSDGKVQGALSVGAEQPAATLARALRGLAER